MAQDRHTIRKHACILACLIFCSIGLQPISAYAQSLTLTPASDSLSEALEAAALSLAPEDTATPADILALAQGDYERLLAVLYDEGYFGPSISIRLAGQEAASLSALSPPARVLPVDIEVSSGPRFRFGTARISPLPPGSEPSETFTKDAPARVPAIRRAAGNAVSGWREASHATARIAEQSISARHAEARLDVTVRLEPGPALRFGDLVLTEAGAVRAERLQKIAGLPTGAPFHPADIDRARQRLIDTGAFRSVILREAEVPNPDDTLDIELSLEDAPPRRIGFGAEISNDEGVSFEAFWLHRNIFGGAERLRFDLDIDGIGGATDGIDYALATSLSIPGFRRADDTLALEIRLQSLDENTFDSNIAELSLARTRKVDEAFEVTVGVGFRFATSEDVFGEREFRHILIDWRATYDKRDDSFRPRAGYYAELSFLPFIGLAGDASGVKIDAEGRAYQGLGPETTAAMRLKAGSVLGASLADTPPDFRFLSGGGGTVRGQSFQSLGVTVPGGLTGGLSFLGASAELRRDVGSNLGLVAFTDIGFVGPDSDFSNLESHAGFGVGARYNTGLGPLRVDIGLPTDDPAFDRLQLYVGLGEAF